MQRKPARPALGMNDVKTRLAEILADHIGKTGIIFDEKDAFAHDCPSTGVHQPRCQRAHHGLPSAIQSATFRRCSGLSTSAASASPRAMAFPPVSGNPDFLA